MKMEKAPVPLIVPNPDDPRLTQRVSGIDQTGATVEIKVPVERPLTLYLNAQEIVTMMTIGDYPEYLALGYLTFFYRWQSRSAARGAEVTAYG